MILTYKSIFEAREISQLPNVSAGGVAAVNVGTGAVASLFLPYIIGKALKGEMLSESKEKLLKGISVAALPISIVLLPVTAPMLAINSAQKGVSGLKE